MDEATQKTIDQLEALLESLLSAHEQLLALMQQKHELLRLGDTDGMTQVCQVENEKIQAISEQEKQRLELAADLTRRLFPNAQQPLGVKDLAEQLPEPMRGRLLTRRQQLRERMEAVREQSSIARRATESLMNHVNGLVRTLTNLATNAATYDRAGGPPQASPAVRTLNVTA